jgi:solute carrier family 13 (sodium-dependent dicarboxylate transporter), member 2/3/5
MPPSPELKESFRLSRPRRKLGQDSRRFLCIGLAIFAFALIRYILPLPGIEGDGIATRTGLAILACVAILWLTEALPLAVTALLVPMLAIGTGIWSGGDQSTTALSKGFASFAHPLIFLFLGGFALAAALSRQEIDRWIASRLLLLARGKVVTAAILLFAATAILSMWISNTSTAAMMLPLALGLLRAGQGDSQDPAAAARLSAFVLLGIAYSANVGGLGTIVGSPPNGIAAQRLGISFAGWMRFGIPAAILLWLALLGLLLVLFRPKSAGIASSKLEGFSWTAPRIAVLIIFAITIAAWLSSTQLGAALGVTRDMDSAIAIAALIALAATGLVAWRDIDRTTDWGVLLLFGGGLTLSRILDDSGGGAYLSQLLTSACEGLPTLAVLAAVVFFVIFLTEVTSNTAVAALMVPLFYSVATQLDLAPETFVIPLAMAASCAFMLPVATPPNAIVFGSGLVPQLTMMRAGLVLNLILGTLLIALSYLLFA